ncbi:DUF4405 domain-containing protein [Ideonella sp. DXS22W]|uniref:DUF4405 domain-containing protein n=1 Tax=Pseudaquabacterium inlustre TaxID=2984192 RepID=A0ABU9CM43_9BURK
MKISRDWATPLTIGAFALMGVTGILMFFHLDIGLNKLAHEWLGWAMVAGVALHCVVNWPAFKRHLTANRMGQAVIGVSLVVLAATFVIQPPAKEGGGSPPVRAMQAVLGGTLAQVAPLTGRSVDALQADLKAAGFAISDASQPLKTLTGNDRERTGRLIGVLFRAGNAAAKQP